MLICTLNYIRHNDLLFPLQTIYAELQGLSLELLLEL